MNPQKILIMTIVVVLTSSPSWSEGNKYIEAYNTMGDSGFELVDFVFKICVILLVDFAEFIGVSYEFLNIIVFIFLQPALILVFFILWRIERKKNRSLGGNHEN